MENKDWILSRTALLIGDEALAKLQGLRVILFGVGGVGSWCAESLIRSGVGHLTLVDSDAVHVTNINRQLPATTQTVGQPKVEVLKARLLDINPDANIVALQDVYTPQTAAQYALEGYDYVLDAIDSLENKVHLIQTATRLPGVFFSSMGAALKMNPSRIQTAEFWKVQGCPLAAALRRRLKKEGLPAKKFRCVFSDEVLPNKGQADRPGAGATSSQWDQRKAAINGTLVHITAIFGFTLAGLVVQDVCNGSL